jgi:hypothetical protein
MAIVEVQAKGLEYLALATKLLQRARLADAEAGVGRRLTCSGGGAHRAARTRSTSSSGSTHVVSLEETVCDRERWLTFGGVLATCARTPRAAPVFNPLASGCPSCATRGRP